MGIGSGGQKALEREGRRRRSVGCQYEPLKSRAGLLCESIVCSLGGRQECQELLMPARGRGLGARGHPGEPA